MYIVQRQILKVVDNWSIISTALATLEKEENDASGRQHPPCMHLDPVTLLLLAKLKQASQPKQSLQGRAYKLY